MSSRTSLTEAELTDDDTVALIREAASTTPLGSFLHTLLKQLEVGRRVRLEVVPDQRPQPIPMLIDQDGDPGGVVVGDEHTGLLFVDGDIVLVCPVCLDGDLRLVSTLTADQAIDVDGSWVVLLAATVSPRTPDHTECGNGHELDLLPDCAELGDLA